MIAKAAHHHQVLHAPKGSVLPAKDNDEFGHDLADAGQLFDLFDRRSIDI